MQPIKVLQIDLDASDTVTDVFTIHVSDGTATDTATLTITVTGS